MEQISEEEAIKIEKGLEIKKKVESLLLIAGNSYNHTGYQIQKAQEEIKKLWDTCEHKYEWIDCNPYSETCTCIYCNADSPGTRNF